MAEKTFEITLNALVYGGDALGRLPDGRALFVPYGLPGELVRVRLVEDRPRFARGELLEVLTPSPDRIPPRCNHAECGGCHYQHMRYPAQLAAKTNIVRDQFQRIAGVPEPPVLPAIASPRQWNYRNTVQFHLTPEGKLGFQESGSHHVVPLTDCPLAEETLEEVWPLLDFEGVPEGIERIILRAGAEGDVMLIFESADPQTPELNVELPISIVHLVSDDQGQTYPVVLAGDDHVVMEALGRNFRVSAGSFFQVNRLQAENMVRYLLDHLPLNPQTFLMELYAGVGLFSAFLAPRVARLAAVESAASAVDDFAANLDEFDNVELYSGLAEEVLPALVTGEGSPRPDICLVDPPRAGLALPALDALVKMAPRHLAYVSCDPATLARDAKRLLAAGYHLESIQPFDMFPQTYHVECVVLMSRVV